jgi:hypothetical protein
MTGSGCGGRRRPFRFPATYPKTPEGTRDGTIIRFKDWDHGRLAVHEGGAHGLARTRKDRVNADLLAFPRS